MIPNVRPSYVNETNALRLVALLGVGHANAIPADTLRQRLGVSKQRTAETVRALVLFAIEECHIAIGSGPDGYYLIATEAELGAVVTNYERRIRGIEERIAALREAWNVRNGEAA
jgi:hypothetical protein